MDSTHHPSDDTATAQQQTMRSWNWPSTIVAWDNPIGNQLGILCKHFGIYDLDAIDGWPWSMSCTASPHPLG